MWKPEDNASISTRLQDRTGGIHAEEQITLAERRMFRRFIVGLSIALALLLMLIAAQLNAATPSPQELADLKDWTRDVSGSVVYTHQGRVKKIVLGESTPSDLGPGEYARWSPDGKRLAVFDKGVVFVMNSDGSDRRELTRGARLADGSPIEFHSNNEEIIFIRRREGLLAVHTTTGATRKLNAPGEYSGEPSISGDGTRMAARFDNDLYMIDLTTGARRKYARGCSPNVSPSGQRVMNNVGSHREIQIRNWDGSDLSKVAATIRPDRQWDNHHWSNHEDYIAAEGENRGNNIYVVNVRDGKSLRVSWESGVSPDVFIASAPESRARHAPISAPVAQIPQPANAPEGFHDNGEWPMNHTGLVFFWKDANAPNEILDATGKTIRTCRLMPAGAARFGRHFDLDLSGGAFFPEDADDPLLDACRVSGEISIELIFTPSDPAVHQGHSLGRLIAFSQGTHERNFTLNQSGTQLEAHLRTSDQRRGSASSVTLDTLVPGKPMHILVTYRDGELIYYRDGKEALRSDRIRGDLSNWEPAALSIGDEKTGGRNASGAAEGIAIYSRVVTGEEAAARFRLQAGKLNHPPAERFAINAVLIETSTIPDPASIQPYRRALVVNTYQLGEATAPKSSGGKIQVAEWAILDGRTVPSARKSLGQTCPLLIEPFENHPQLESERLVSDSEDFDIPMYYDIRPPSSGVIRVAGQNNR